MAYGFHTSGQGRYQIKADGVTVDAAREVLVVTASHSRYDVEPVRQEFPLILARLCTTCGSPVAVYAQGSIASFERLTSPGLFERPWDPVPGWKRLDTPGGFALVADRGHHFTWTENRLRAECHETELRLVKTPLADVVPPPPPAPRPPKPPRPKRAEPPPAQPPSAVPLPDATVPATTQRRPRTQLTFAW
jgi:hypothetical protein